MSNLCECCGKKNNSFTGDPLRLPYDKILCHKCAEPIAYEINLLFGASTIEEIATIGNSILSKGKEIYSTSVLESLQMLIDARIQHKKKSIVTATSQNSPTSGAGLFKNIGSKIKGLAQFITWIGIIASIIVGFSFIMIDDDMAFIGVLIMFIGSFFSWISSFLLYGFGQLIDNSDKILNELKK